MGVKDIHKWKPMRIIKLSRYLISLANLLSKIPHITNAGLYILRPLYEPVKETWLNRKLRYILLTVGGGLLPADILRAYGYGAKAFLENFKDVLKAYRKNEPIIWVEWILNRELIEGFGEVSFNNTCLSIFANLDSMYSPSLLIEEAERQGTPVENCSAMKLDVGALALKQLPNPHLMITSSHPCDSTVTVAQTLEYLTDAPSFIFDIPYWTDVPSYEYIERQLWEAIAFLEKHLGKKMDWDRFKQGLERVNKLNHYLGEICEMHRAVPSPGSMINLMFAWAVRVVNVTSPNALKMAEMLYKAVKKNYERGTGTVKKEKIRVLLWFPPIAFFMYIFKWMEKTFDAVVVADFIGHISTVQIDTSTKESMIKGLARTQMNLAMGRQCHGTAELITDEMEWAFDAYQVDCMIFTGHQGCKHGWAAARIIQDICKKRDMPALYISLDIMDQRFLNEQEIRDEITAFFECNGWA